MNLCVAPGQQMTLRSSRPIILLITDRINCNNNGYEFWSFFKNQKGLSFHSAHFRQSLTPFNATHYVSAFLHQRSFCLSEKVRQEKFLLVQAVLLQDRELAVLGHHKSKLQGILQLHYSPCISLNMLLTAFAQ